MRRVRQQVAHQGSSTLGCVSLVFLPFVLLILVALVMSLYQNTRIAWQGVDTVGVVTGAQTVSARRILEGAPQTITTLYLMYQYRVAGKIYHAEQIVSPTQLRRHPSGRRVTVRYVADDPGTNALITPDLVVVPAYTTSPLVAVVLSIVVVLPLVGLAVFLKQRHRRAEN